MASKRLSGRYYLKRAVGEVLLGNKCWRGTTWKGLLEWYFLKRVVGEVQLGKDCQGGTSRENAITISDYFWNSVQSKNDALQTLYSNKNSYKTTWMHLCSKHWHLIDYIIVQQRDLKNIYRSWVISMQNVTLILSTCRLQNQLPIQSNAKERKWSQLKILLSKRRSTFGKTFNLNCRTIDVQIFNRQKHYGITSS